MNCEELSIDHLYIYIDGQNPLSESWSGNMLDTFGPTSKHLMSKCKGASVLLTFNLRTTRFWYTPENERLEPKNLQKLKVIWTILLHFGFQPCIVRGAPLCWLCFVESQYFWKRGMWYVFFSTPKIGALGPQFFFSVPTLQPHQNHCPYQNFSHLELVILINFLGENPTKQL